MRHLALAAHLGRTVQIDHCGACRLVWFDALESVALAPLGWVTLLRELQLGSGLVLPEPQATASGGALACPQCRHALKTVHNRTRFGAFAALECPQGHGHLHTHSGLLAERGLARPLLPAERDALLRGRKALACVNCGAPVDGRSTACSHCGSPVVIIDLPRLMHALTRPLGDDAPSPRADGQHTAWHCVACGTSLDPARQATCPACGTAALAPSLPAVEPLLDAAAAALKTPPPPPAPSAAERRATRRSRQGERWRETTLYSLRDWLRHDDDDRPPSVESLLWQWMRGWPAPWRWAGLVAAGVLLAWWVLA